MLEVLRKTLPIASPVSTDIALSGVALVSFVFLLSSGFVQPFAIYLLELYLAL